MDSESIFSNILSKTLDSLGYSYSAIQRRIQLYNNLNKENKLSNRKCNFELILAGSKREGVSLQMESDFDYMQVFKGVECSDRLPSRPTNTITFLLEMNNEPFGYTKLKVCDVIGICTLLEVACQSGSHFISSEYLMKYSDLKNRFGTDKIKKTILPRSGPSLPIKLIQAQGFEIDIDIVSAIPCTCPEYITTWVSRQRYNGFPSRETISKVSKLDAHVVAVGYKLSSDQDIQWRICYTLAEIHLIQTFNPIQYQLYILLKMVSKNKLKSKFPFLTSYIMKNIALWIAEVTPQCYFVNDYLSTLLVRSILFLRMCVCDSFLPSYMIPKRNLLIRSILPNIKEDLKHELLAMANDGGAISLVCPRIAQEIVILYKNPECYENRIIYRIALEQMVTYGYSSTEDNIYSDSDEEIGKRATLRRYQLQLYQTVCDKDPGLLQRSLLVYKDLQVFQSIKSLQVKPSFIANLLRDPHTRSQICEHSRLNPMLEALFTTTEQQQIKQLFYFVAANEFRGNTDLTGESIIACFAKALTVVLHLFCTPEKICQLAQSEESVKYIINYIYFMDHVIKHQLKSDSNDLELLSAALSGNDKVQQNIKQSLKKLVGQHPYSSEHRDFIIKHLSGDSA